MEIKRIIKEKNAAKLKAGEENLLEIDTANYVMKFKDQLAIAALNNIPHKMYDSSPSEVARKVWAIVEAIEDERAFFKPMY